jgi:hypothetical protein
VKTKPGLQFCESFFQISEIKNPHPIDAFLARPFPENAILAFSRVRSDVDFLFQRFEKMSFGVW